MTTYNANAPIFGLSSQVGGAIAIMRCSGKNCLEIAQNISKSNQKDTDHFQVSCYELWVFVG